VRLDRDDARAELQEHLAHEAAVRAGVEDQVATVDELAVEPPSCLTVRDVAAVEDALVPICSGSPLKRGSVG
jgi:hypothetical protein